MKKLLYILLFLPLLSFGQGNLKINATSLEVTGDIVYSYTHAVLSQAAGATYTVSVATQNVPVKLAPTFTTIEADGTTIAGDTVQVTLAGDYFVRIYGNFASANNNDITINCRVNNSLTAISSYQGSGTSINNYTPIAYEWYFKDVPANAWISIWLRNTTNADDPVIRDLRLVITKAPED